MKCSFQITVGWKQSYIFFFKFTGNCGNTCATFQNNYLAWEASGIGRHLVFLFLQGVFYFIVLLTTESGWLRALWYQVRRIRTKCGDTEPVSQPGSVHSLIQVGS